MRSARDFKLYYSVDIHDIHIASISTEHDHAVGSEQWAWLRADLARAAAASRWLIVFGHRPMHSSSSHHGSFGSLMEIDSLLAEFEVDVCVWGHDHKCAGRGLSVRLIVRSSIYFTGLVWMRS